MMGKLAGNVGVGADDCRRVFARRIFLAHYYGYTEMLPVRILAWFIAFEVLASLLFCAVPSASTPPARKSRKPKA